MYPLSEVFVLRILRRSILLALAFALLLAPAVVAHAELESATPGPDDEVVGSPTELVTQFSQNLDPSRTTLEVRDAAGTRIARGGEPGDGKREFRLALPELAPGEYEVRWTSYSSEDQELARGSYTFTVLPAPSPTPSATPSPSARPSATAISLRPPPRRPRPQLNLLRHLRPRPRLCRPLTRHCRSPPQRWSWQSSSCGCCAADAHEADRDRWARQQRSVRPCRRRPQHMASEVDRHRPSRSPSPWPGTSTSR